MQKTFNGKIEHTETIEGSNRKIQSVLNQLTHHEIDKSKTAYTKCTNEDLYKQFEIVSRDIKLMNMELKRVVSTEEDAYLHLSDDMENQIDCVGHMPVLAEMKIFKADQVLKE